MTREAAVSLLLQLLDDENPHVRDAAAAALHRVGGPPADAVPEGIDSPDPRARKDAIRALGQGLVFREDPAAIPPLIEIGPIDPDVTARLAQRWHLNGRTRVGFAARFAAEKGVEHLLEALPTVMERLPDLQLVFTGAYKDAVGEEQYLARLVPLLRRYADRLTATAPKRKISRRLT